MGTYVPGWGASDARLMLIGEAPGSHETAQGRPFVGPTGGMVDECLDYAGIDRNSVYKTNVCKVQPPNNDLGQLNLIGRTIEEFIPQLIDEINTINPNCILAIGGVSLEYLTGFSGIKKYRGSILPCKLTTHKVVATMHPAMLLHGGGEVASWKEFAYIKQDFKRAAEQATFPEIKVPQRNLWVARTSLDVIRFLEKYQGQDKCTLDVETWRTFAQCIGLSFSSDEAISIPTFHDDIQLHDLAYIWKLLAEFLNDTRIKLIAQNAKFDEKRCRQLGLKWHDCWFDMSMGWHILFSEFPKKLQFISSMITDEPYYKDEGSEYDPKKHKIDRWFLYNAKDAAVEYECTEKILAALVEYNLYDFFFNKIMPLHRVYSDMEDVGLLVDKEVRKSLGKKYRNLQVDIHEKLLRNIADGDTAVYESYKKFNVMSNGPKNQVAKLLFGFLGFPVRRDTKDDTLKALANNHGKDTRKKEILFGILNERKVRKTIGTYIEAELTGNTLDECLLPGRIESQVNLNGTESGRTTTGIVKSPVSIEHRGIALQTMTKHEDITLSAGGADLRSMYIADPGWSFIEPDLSQAEDRVVCVLAKDWDALKDYERTNYRYNKFGLKDDRHTITAMYVCELGFDVINDYERQCGKKSRHSGNYNVGKHQHMLTLGKSGIFISEWKAGKQLDRFHGENPKIRNVFHAEIIEALQRNDCRLISPHGRPRIFFNKWGEDLWKEAYAQIPQATVSDQVKFAMVKIVARLKREWFRFVEESHDSFLALCKDEYVQHANIVIKEELEAPIDFRACTLSRDYQLVIPCEIKCGKRWIEYSNEWQDGMRKVKV